LLAGEESGGASIAGHIPEKDGIMICLLVLKAVCDGGRPLRVLLDDIYKNSEQGMCLSGWISKLPMNRRAVDICDGQMER